MPPQRLTALPSHSVPGDLPAAASRMSVAGLVESPLRLTLGHLTKLSAMTLAADFACEEGWVLPDFGWAEVSVATLLEHVSPRPEATRRRVGAGGYTVALPLAEAAAGALLAFRLDGNWLTPAHGVPLRLIAPGRACFFSVKWVDRLELRTDPGETTGQTSARRGAP